MSDSYVHKTANIWGGTTIGEGTRIGAFCDIGDAMIGKNCKIQCHVSIPPGTIIEDSVFIGPGARFANDKKPDLKKHDWEPEGAIVSEGAVIGMGALIGAGVRIGYDSVVGMGAVVTKDVPDGETWVGNPAHKL